MGKQGTASPFCFVEFSRKRPRVSCSVGNLSVFFERLFCFRRVFERVKPVHGFGGRGGGCVCNLSASAFSWGLEWMEGMDVVGVRVKERNDHMTG